VHTQEDEVLKRDTTAPTLEDHFNKSVLPKVMQVGHHHHHSPPPAITAIIHHHHHHHLQSLPPPPSLR
jgi:hypothetical protein